MKFMNLKRFGATLMAGVMAASLTVPALASSTTIDGSYTPITLAVTVPKTGKAIINPYGLPYKLDDTTSISGEEITTGAALMIQNRSVVALKVGAKVTGTVKEGSDVVLTTSAPSATNKEIKATFQAFEALGVTEANASETEQVNVLFAALKSADAVLTATIDPTQEVAAAKAGANELILREGNADSEMQNGGAAFFRLSGEVTEAPTNSDWAKTDGFTATIAFTFTPDEYVGKAVATDIAASQATLSMAGTKTGTITAAVMPDGIKAVSTVYSTDDATVLKVDAKTGAYEALKSGSAKVIATIEGSDGLPYTSEVTITVTA